MNYPVVRLADVDLSTLRPIKELVLRHGDQDHSRWVFRTRPNDRYWNGQDLFLKLWNSSYVRANNLLSGIDSGLYGRQTTPALKAIIFDDRVCRGYIMHRCQQNSRVEPRFYALVKQRTLDSGCFHVQFSPYHMMRFQGAYSLVDLEGVYAIADLPRMPSLHCVFDYPPYARWVAELYNTAFPRSTVDIAPLLDAPSTPPGAYRRVIRFPLRKSRALYKHIRRWIANEFGVAFKHMYLIER